MDWPLSLLPLPFTVLLQNQSLLIRPLNGMQLHWIKEIDKGNLVVLLEAKYS